MVVQVEPGGLAADPGRSAHQLIPPYPGHEYDVSFLKHEFFFERIVDMRAEPRDEGTR
ncbi:hypothetical protein ACFVHW_00420 [Streptomyces sp. NPDC127110]|uniref:hypothetical protein n=1 Tax=Streptomyces sp. NPDC127110 TaxID=3345362 RepID=UPI003632519B